MLSSSSSLPLLLLYSKPCVARVYLCGIEQTSDVSRQIFCCRVFFVLFVSRLVALLTDLITDSKFFFLSVASLPSASVLWKHVNLNFLTVEHRAEPCARKFEAS